MPVIDNTSLVDLPRELAMLMITDYTYWLYTDYGTNYA